MTAAKYDSRRLLRLLCWLGCGIIAVAAVSTDAYAQGIRRKGGGPKSGPRQPAQPQEDKPRDIPSSVEGRILSYDLADDKDREKDEELVGFLKIKPFDKDQRVLKLSVRRATDVDFRLGDHKFEMDDMKDVLTKGLHCTAGWGYVDPDSKKKVKELRSLSLNTIEVDGKVDKIEDGAVVIKARPSNNSDWPGADQANSGRPVNTNGSNKPKKVALKKLTLKLLEDITRLVNNESEEISMGDLEVGKEVHAKVVFSHGGDGYVVVLGPPDADVNTPKPHEPEGGGGQPPPRGGPRPRGGGPRI